MPRSSHGRLGGGGGDARRLAAAAQLDVVAELPAAALVRAGALQRGRGGEHAGRMALGELGQPRRLVDRVADDRVLEALGRADVAGDRLAGRDADAEVGAGDLLGEAAAQRAGRGERRAEQDVDPQLADRGAQRVALRAASGGQPASTQRWTGRCSLKLQAIPADTLTNR